MTKPTHVLLVYKKGMFIRNINIDLKNRDDRKEVETKPNKQSIIPFEVSLFLIKDVLYSDNLLFETVSYQNIIFIVLVMDARSNVILIQSINIMGNQNHVPSLI